MLLQHTIPRRRALFLPDSLYMHIYWSSPLLLDKLLMRHMHPCFIQMRIYIYIYIYIYICTHTHTHTIVTFCKEHALKKRHIFSLMLTKIQPCHFLSEVTFWSSDCIFYQKNLAWFPTVCWLSGMPVKMWHHDIYIYIYIYIHTCIHMHAYTQIYINKHTHTHPMHYQYEYFRMKLIR